MVAQEAVSLGQQAIQPRHSDPPNRAYSCSLGSEMEQLSAVGCG
jgi:hypothetical protein